MCEPLQAKTVLFSPFALVWQHAFPASIIAKAISELGGDVSVVTCEGGLNASCVVYRSRKLDPSANPRGAARTCAHCKRVSGRRIVTDVNTYALDDFISETGLQQIDDYCNAVEPGPVTDALLHEHPIARFALYTHTITHRAETTDVADEHVEAFRREIQSVGMALMAGERFAAEHRPEIVIVSDLLYGANRAFVAGVRNSCPEARAVGLYDSPNQAVPFTTFQWVEDVASTPFAAAKSAWPQLVSNLADANGIDNVGEYMKTSITGRRFRSFSSAVDPDAPSLRRDVLASDCESTIALIALSSEDEALASRESGGVVYWPQPYQTQLHWLEDLSAVADEFPDTQFVIRPHPRFWSNPGNSQRRTLQARQVSFHPRMRLLTPEQFPSLYALLNEADVVLTSWSTVGIEARVLGIPALAYATDLQGAPDPVLPAPSTRDDYLSELRTTLTSRRWNFDTAVEMFRWLDFAWHRSNLDLSSVLPERFNHQTRASSTAKSDYLDLVAYRFLPATMARLDMRQANDLAPVRRSVQKIIRDGIVAYAAAQVAAGQTPSAEADAIRVALKGIARLLPEVSGMERMTLRERLMALS